MTHRIVNTFRSLALAGVVTLGLRQPNVRLRAPEPRRSGAEPEDVSDSWMFDRPHTSYSSEAFQLEQAYGRVSGSLAGLRAVLTSLTRMPLEADVPYEPITASGTVEFDPALFDEVAAPVPVLTNVVAFDEDDLFIESGLTLQKPSGSIESLARVA
jgi:hypothetical protein